MQEISKRENFKQEILYKMIKEKTWDTMDEHLKAINGLNSNIIVHNFHIRKRSPLEIRKLNLVKNMRLLEIKEKLNRKDNK